MTGPQEVQRLRRQHLVKRLHRLGPRAIFELFDEIAEKFGIEEQVDARLAAYVERLTPEILVATGGDRLATVPLYAVRGGR